mgnify:CR=1 FL=1
MALKNMLHPSVFLLKYERGEERRRGRREGRKKGGRRGEGGRRRVEKERGKGEKRGVVS